MSTDKSKAKKSIGDKSTTTLEDTTVGKARKKDKKSRKNPDEE